MSILFLIGPRGSGKTVAAALLERDYACRACDTDALIQEASGRTVAEIVAEEGWSAFREREKNALRACVARMADTPSSALVVATGGGIVLDPDNCSFMRAHGVVVYLAASADVLASRLELPAKDSSRPSLTGLPLKQEIMQVLKERLPLYNATAHHTVDAALPPEEVARTLSCLLSSECAGGAL